MIKRILFSCLLLAFFGATGCTHQEVEPLTRFAVDFMSGRQGELEPCGCPSRPLGGVDRELNARSTLKSAEVPQWSLTAGPQFVSAQKVQPPEYALRRASFLLDAWNKLGLEVAAADSYDFVYGVDVFQKLIRQTKTSWVSANLYVHGKRLLPASSTRVFGPHTLVVFGVTSCNTKVAGLECREPVAALKSAIETARFAPNTKVVLLSSVDDETVERMWKEIPQAVAIFNSPTAAALPGVVEEPGHRWLASPTPRGRALVRMEVVNGDWQKATSQTVYVDADFANPPNELRQVIEGWRQTQHDAALKQ